MPSPVLLYCLRSKPFHVGAVALHEALVVLVVAGGEDHAAGGVEPDVLAVGVLAHDAGAGAGLVDDQLDTGGLEVEVHAALGRELGQGVDELVVGVGLGSEAVAALHAHGAVVEGDGGLGDGVGREARLHGADLHPADGLAGVVVVELGQAAVGAPVAVGDEALHVVLDALLVAEVEHDAGGGAALGDGGALLLQAAGGGALLDGGEGGGHAAGAGAHDHDVVGVLGGELGDGGEFDGAALEV